MFQQIQCIILRDLQHVDFLGDVGQLELGQAVLAGAEEFAGAAELQIHLGDLEAVVGVASSRCRRSSAVSVVRVGDQQAVRLLAAAADAAAKLVQLATGRSARRCRSASPSRSARRCRLRSPSSRPAHRSRRSRNAVIVRCFSSVSICPCSIASRRPASGPLLQPLEFLRDRLWRRPGRCRRSAGRRCTPAARRRLACG